MKTDWSLQPPDEHNDRLRENTHPTSWKNPIPAGRYNLVAVGGGTAGIISALGAAGLGGKAALIERRLLGGDCLNFGCVPSKALLAAAKQIHAARQLAQYGAMNGPINIDFAAVMRRLRSLRADISQHDSAERFKSLGTDVYLGDARFVGPQQIHIGGQTLPFSKAVIATGGRALVPQIPGLDQAGYYTNETIFGLTELPATLLVIGGGPIGCELAQAFARLGSQVVVIQSGSEILPKEDPEAAAIVRESLLAEGMRVILNGRASSVELRGQQKVLHVETPQGPLALSGDAILIAAGRVPNLEGLGLEAANVQFNARGIVVDDCLRSSNPRIFAAGDVAGSFQFTHAADAMARICIRNALFMGKARLSQLIVPRVTYTGPELAHVGLTPAEAEQQGIKLDTYRVDFARVDRAVLEGQSEGFAKIHTQQKTGRVVGATAVGQQAGELIGEMALLMQVNAPLAKLAATIHAYPTRSEVWRKAADLYQKTRLTPLIAGLFKRWLAWQR